MRPRPAPELLDRLTEITERNRTEAKAMAELPPERLNHAPGSGKWNALECFEHLNRFGEMYTGEISRKIATAKHPATPTFTSGWLGNKLAAGMKPGPRTRKVKTFPSMNPGGTGVAPTAIETFIEQQDEILRLLEAAREVDLTRTRVKTALPLLRIRLGDGLRLLVYHNWRHVEQARRAAGLETES